VHVYFPAFSDTHCIYPQRDGQAQLAVGKPRKWIYSVVFVAALVAEIAGGFFTGNFGENSLTGIVFVINRTASVEIPRQ